MLVRPYLNPSGELPAFFVDSQIEQTVEKAIEYSEQSSHINLAPQKIREILDKVTRAVGTGDAPMAVVTSSSARYYLRQMIEGQIPNLSILSHNEIPSGVKVVSMGLIQ
jgi:flagellar biosynthesis protein FlhA